MIKNRTLRTLSCGCPPLDALINVLMILIAIATDFTTSFLSHWANERCFHALFLFLLFLCRSCFCDTLTGCIDNSTVPGREGLSKALCGEEGKYMVLCPVCQWRSQAGRCPGYAIAVCVCNVLSVHHRKTTSTSKRS